MDLPKTPEYIDFMFTFATVNRIQIPCKSKMSNMDAQLSPPEK